MFGSVPGYDVKTSDRSPTCGAPILMWTPESRGAMRRAVLCLAGVGASMLATGCAQRHQQPEPIPTLPPLVVAVTPVLNLSNRSDWDALQVTDMLVLAAQSLPEFAVVPEDRVLATLAERGQDAIETQEGVQALGRELGADLVIVAALTDFDPYDPPRVAMTLQATWTRSFETSPGGRFDPVTASRQASDVQVRPDAARSAEVPDVQIQAVFDASEDATQRQMRAYAQERHGHQSPYGWRLHGKSQELFLRFSCHRAILTIRQEIERYRSNATGRSPR